MKHLLAKGWRVLNLPKGVQLFLMRFANDSFLIGVTTVILNEKNEVLVLKHTYRQTEWSLPGGFIKKGEHPLEAAAREVKEETGFSVKLHHIMQTVHDTESARLDLRCFGHFTGGKFIPSDEVTDYGFFSFEELPHIGRKQKKLVETVLRRETTYFEIPKRNWLRWLPFGRKN